MGSIIWGELYEVVLIVGGYHGEQTLLTNPSQGTIPRTLSLFPAFSGKVQKKYQGDQHPRIALEKYNSKISPNK